MDKKFIEAAEYLKGCDDVYIMTHQSPDGDTLGSAFALWNVLRLMKKRARVLCHDEIPPKFSFLMNGYVEESFEPKCVICVDIAEKGLLGESLLPYCATVNLCIDHHISNRKYAERTLVCAEAAATCEVLFELFNAMGIQLTKQIATCLYTGIATDTGCFKYSNTSVNTHIAAAMLIACHIDHAGINRQMFDVKSRERIALEAYIDENTDYIFDNKAAVITITDDVQKRFSMKPSDFEGLASMATRVDTVEVGVIIKQRTGDTFKISMRSTSDINVSDICSDFGGGGHVRAAGCTLSGTLSEVRKKIEDAIGARL